MEWANEQAEYVKTFVYAVIAAIVNPATIIHTEYANLYRTVKEIQADGKWKEKKVLDEVMSGFRDTLVPLDELFIADVYEHDIQKQPYLIWRKVLNWSTAYQKYGDNADFKKYVRPGLQIMFDSDSDAFYEQYDKELQEHLVEEVVYFDRYQDLQLSFVNGVLLTDPDQPMTRVDKLYPFVKGGYELVDEGKFFYYFSLVRKMKDDAEIINRLYQAFIDGSLLRNMPPGAVMGDEIINASVIVPGRISVMGGETKYQPIDVGIDAAAGLAALEKMELSVSESSNDSQQSGQGDNLPDTYGQQVLLERNARVMLGLFGKMIGFMVRDLGKLRVGDILQYLTIADVEQIVGDDAPLRYRSFLIPEKIEDGKKKSHKIMLGDYAQNLSEDETTQGFDMLALQGGASPDGLQGLDPEQREQFIGKGFDADTKLYLVNPEIFRNLKYKVVVRPDMITPPSDALKKALNLELYDRAIANPLANQEAIFTDFLLSSYEGARDDTSKYVTKPENQMGAMQGQQGNPLQKIFGQGRTQATAEAAPTQWTYTNGRAFPGKTG